MRVINMDRPLRVLSYAGSAWLGLIFVLVGCTSDSGQVGVINPPPDVNDPEQHTVVYEGPSPSSAEVNNFKRALWDNLAMTSRCGACHMAGGESPRFVRRDDINLAYAAVVDYVNLEDPASSALVNKVATGHNCWTANVDFCAERISLWITQWATDSGVELTEAALRRPELFAVTASLNFPSDSSAFSQTVHPVLREHCAECHRADAPQAPVQPYFSSSDPALAYAAAQSVMLFNLQGEVDGDDSIDASRSRLVVRLREESHNCWNDNCATSAELMEQALLAFAQTLEVRETDSTLLTSKAMRVADGTAISQGGRIENNAIAIYAFKAGRGNVVNDYSDGFPPQLDLTLYGDVEWVGNWGIRLNQGRAQGAVTQSAKLHRYISQTGEYSIEAWVVPANVSQDGPARIVSYSGSNTERNFTLGQTLYNYNFLNRNSNTNLNGNPSYSTPDADEVLQATLQHVVASYDSLTGRRLYVNGQEVGEVDMAGGGNLNDWDNTYALVLGNETSGQYPWRGTLRFLAIHNRALTQEQAQINYQVGVGQKILVPFSISHLIEGMEDAYIVFQVQQFDDYSYLFSDPYFFSFTETLPSDLTIEGLYLGVNGREARAGQTYAKLQVNLPAANFNPDGMVLSRLGAVIELEKGPEQDQFFLSFDRIGARQFDRPANLPPADTTEPQDLPAAEGVGVRHFAAINASLSAMTGIPVTEPAVANTYERVQQQLPAEQNIQGFLVSHQMGITQLAVSYCNVLAADETRRAAYFPDFDGSRFDDNGRRAVINPLLTALLGHNIASEGTQLSNQPLAEDAAADLNALIDTLTRDCPQQTCPAAVTRSTLTAVCAAAMGSALMLVH